MGVVPLTDRFPFTLALPLFISASKNDYLFKFDDVIIRGHLLQVELVTRGNVLVLGRFEAHEDPHKVGYQEFPGEHKTVRFET